MEAKIEKISELSKLLSVKTRMSDDLFHLFGKFGIGHLLSRLSLEKQDGVSASELLLSLCLFRIVGESIHSICKHKIYELSNHGKNCFYRMMIRPQMDWRRLMNHFALRYMCLLRKYGEVPQSDTTTCFIIDDTVLEKSGVRMEGISRVFDHMKGRCVLGYKLLLCAFFDGKTTIPFDFSLHQEKGKQGNYGLTRQQLKKAYHTKRNTGNPDYKRFQECKMSKLEVAMDMLRRGWKMGLHAKYVITDSWFTCEQLMTCVRSIGKGAMHFVGLAKMGKTKYTISGKKKNAAELIYLLLKTILHKYCNLIRAKTGLEALALFKENEVDLILMDIKMPEMTGIESLKEIRKLSKDIPVIMQSAYVFDSDMEAAKEAGASGFITKPINLKVLKNTISQYCPSIVW